MSEDMLVRIRGEVARRIRLEQDETGAPFTAIVDRRLAEMYAELDKRRAFLQDLKRVGHTVESRSGGE